MNKKQRIELLKHKNIEHKDAINQLHNLIELNDIEIEEIQNEGELIVYVYSSDEVDRESWNSEGDMDYLKGTVQRAQKDGSSIRIKKDTAPKDPRPYDYWILAPHQFMVVEEV